MCQIRPEEHDATEIQGQVTQHDLTQLDEFEQNTEFYREWEKLVRQTVSSLGLSHTDLHLVSPKLLMAQTDQGQQTVHWDDIMGYLSPEAKLSVILYCSSGSSSTAMPRFPSNQFPSDDTDTAALRAASHLLDVEWYHSVPVFAGDMMVFKQSTPHFGVYNLSQSTRIVLFSMMSPEKGAEQDEYQVRKQHQQQQQQQNTFAPMGENKSTTH